MSDTVERPTGAAALGAAVVAGAAVAVAAGVYGQVHDPASETTISLVFSSTLHMKAWVTTIAALLALAQLVSALWMWGRLPLGPAPEVLGPLHRIFGTLALIATLPVAYHCLWSLGFETDTGEPRRFWHSVLGCAFYGAFTTKVLVVRSRRMPGWALPAVGGVVFTMLILLWMTSSLWFYDTVGVEF